MHLLLFSFPPFSLPFLIFPPHLYYSSTLLFASSFSSYLHPSPPLPSPSPPLFLLPLSLFPSSLPSSSPPPLPSNPPSSSSLLPPGIQDSSSSSGQVDTSPLNSPRNSMVANPIIVTRGPNGYGMILKSIRVYIGESNDYRIHHVIDVRSS